MARREPFRITLREGPIVRLASSRVVCQHRGMIHPLDRLAGAAMLLPRASSAIFPRGWGDRRTLEMLGEDLPRSGEFGAADVVWEPKTEHRGYRRRRGSFASPVASLLPEQSRLVHVELNEPSTGTNRAVVLMPAWNDEGFDRRRVLSESLVSRGIATAYFEVPLYGRRRLYGQAESAIGTVADFALMGAGALSEGHALLNALRAGYETVGVAGFSMGGNLAALISAGSENDIATGLMAASHSPGPVYLDGALRRAISWEALGGRDSAAELRELLGSVSATGVAAAGHHGAAVMVAGERDGFVPRSAVLGLADHWPAAEVRWLPAGHATLWWRHRSELVAAVADSFERTAQRRSIS